MVAAAVEIGAAPLAQVNALLLWKRAGAGSCWQPTAPCHAEPKSCRSLGRGLVSPQSSGGAHGYGTAQRWRHSWAERARAGAGLSAGAAAGEAPACPSARATHSPARAGWPS